VTTEGVDSPDPVTPFPQFRVSTDPDGGRLTVVLNGEIDCANSAALSTRLRAIMTTNRVGEVIIDISGLEFCDMTGARMLVEVYHWSRDTGTHCRLYRARPLVRRLLRILGATDVLALPNDHDPCESEV
jgi:anti-anti-sigma factor